MAEAVIGLDSVVTLQESAKIENSDGLRMSNAVGVQMGTDNHVTEAVESKDSVSPQEEENNFFKPRGRVSATTTMNTTATINQGEGEWIEQCEPGVYLNLVLLNDGTRDIKRVRFSRRRFGEHQAETWWSENCKQVYERYNARGPMLKSHLPV